MASNSTTKDTKSTKKKSHHTSRFMPSLSRGHVEYNGRRTSRSARPDMRQVWLARAGLSDSLARYGPIRLGPGSLKGRARRHCRQARKPDLLHFPDSHG